MRVGKAALAVSDFEGGGVERNLTNLARGLARLGVETWLLVGDPEHVYVRDLDPAVRLIPVRDRRTPLLREFLQRERPDLLVTGKLRDDFAALDARAGLAAEAGGATRLVAAVGTPLSDRFRAHRWNPLKTWRETRQIRDAYGRLDGIVAVSESVAQDLRRTFGVSRVPMTVLPNAVIPEDFARLADLPCPHPWLAAGQPPVVLAIGGLRQVKDFGTLIRAFARLCERLDSRLAILGAGKERARLLGLAKRLGVAERVDLPGFVANPFPYLARAAVLALSSRREGLGNVLVEAMALGTPVVATDCPGGVRNLLQDGRLGPLVPVGDAPALAAALERTIRAAAAGTLDRDALRRAAQPYRLLPAARARLDFFETLSPPART